MQNNLVSIIIPVYNVEAYLERCLNSVCRQTYPNIEILLLNDGSTDGSYSICEKWAHQDSRIRLFNDINQGVSTVRNIGLQECRGEYITFVDSDDIISEKYVEILLETIEGAKADIAIASYCTFKSNEQPTFTTSNDTRSLHSDLECCLFEFTSGIVWGKMYKSQIIQQNKILFDKSIAVSEDLLFVFQYLEHCNHLAYNTSVVYGYYQRPNSAVHNTVSPKWFTCLNVYEYLFNAYQSKKVYPYIVYYYLKNLYEARYLLKAKAKNLKINVNIAEEIKKAEKQKKILSRRQKNQLLICKHLMWLVLFNRSRRR